MSSIRIPKLLTAGDTIGIVAPGRKLKSEILEQAISILKTWDVKVVVGKNVFSEAHSYLSGLDNERLSDFQDMIDNPAVKCILCARGGYGSTRFVDRLNFGALDKNPKWLVGFSDVTALHLQFINNNIASIHGTMPVLFPKAETTTSVESIRQILFDGVCTIAAGPCSANRLGAASGVTVGGNLSLLVESLGTKTEIETDNNILIIEEVDEYSYRLDRMITQLKRAGKFQKLRGLIIGHMTDIKEGDILFGETVEEMFMRAAEGTTYPIAFQFPSGHENPNYAWVHGGQALLEVSQENAKLSYKSTKIHS